MKTQKEKEHPKRLAAGLQKQLILDIKSIMDSEQVGDSELSRKIGITTKELRRILSGKSPISLEDTNRISEALGKRMTVVIR